MSIKSKQWFSVTKFFKNEERSLPRNVRKQIYTAREISTQDISQKISTKHSQKVFHQQILKRNSHKQKKISEEKSLPNKIQIETSTTKYLTTQIFTKIIEGEFSTKKYLTKISTKQNFFGRGFFRNCFGDFNSTFLVKNISYIFKNSLVELEVYLQKLFGR